MHRRDWARCIYDQDDGLYIGTRGINDDEATRQIIEENFGHIPVKLFHMPAGETRYVKTFNSGNSLQVNGRSALASGAIRAQATNWLLTVGHLFSSLNEVCLYENDGVLHNCGSPAYLIEKFESSDDFDQLFADIALIPNGEICSNRLSLLYPKINALHMNAVFLSTAEKFIAKAKLN